ncbi:uncharacterized protein L3040_001612 [Drepanopeziza brunnea f. sp. 'multigermtubi']|uniref:uncharacterized protein n=1 Tax=Drepanopeziza brunnea f. sp. 'multigermtubi' TaxID=698441 RepID=UPI00239CBBC2|nr:hypothetical protein L3040_001612 [Drepanopeziza brunnea f. sp. 'multigermtubi']
MPLPSVSQLQEDWKQMYQRTLPSAAKAKAPSQPKWPVQLDHCFARIILDHVVGGVGTPWTAKIKSPAYKNMSREQLVRSIDLGRQILEGEADLAALDGESLRARGKKQKAGRRGDVLAGAGVKITDGSTAGKRKLGDLGESMSCSSDNDAKRIKVLGTAARSSAELKDAHETVLHTATLTDMDTEKREDLVPYLEKIALSQKTEFQKRVLTTLCQVPRGRYTTYGAMAKHLSSSARAVGNALRNNPFAPEVPCHRVLASGGGLGGFHGSWGRQGAEGLHDDKKRKLLRDEGVSQQLDKIDDSVVSATTPLPLFTFSCSSKKASRFRAPERSRQTYVELRIKWRPSRSPTE